MPYIGNTPALDYISYAVQNFTVTAGTTVYTLDYSVANENDIRLVINNVIQRPGASYAYSATGTTLTLTSATQSGDTMYAVFIGRAVQTVTPPANINIQLADGSAGSPSLNFANDTNTGIFRATTDEIALVEGGVEGMRLNASGNVQFAKNISIGGATPTTSGFGITFPATQSASTNANTLDDYEEGTFTPTYVSTSATFQYSAQTGTYTKIGNKVFYFIFIQLDGGGNSFSANALSISGLPFVSSGFTHAIGMPTRLVDFDAGFVNLEARINNGTSEAGIFEIGGDNLEANTLRSNQLSSASGQIGFLGFYTTT